MTANSQRIHVAGKSSSTCNFPTPWFDVFIVLHCRSFLSKEWPDKVMLQHLMFHLESRNRFSLWFHGRKQRLNLETESPLIVKQKMRLMWLWIGSILVFRIHLTSSWHAPDWLHNNHFSHNPHFFCCAINMVSANQRFQASTRASIFPHHVMAAEGQRTCMHA